jgi:hypothetical protein
MGSKLEGKEIIRKNLEKQGGFWGCKPVYEEEIEREEERHHPRGVPRKTVEWEPPHLVT